MDYFDIVEYLNDHIEEKNKQRALEKTQKEYDRYWPSQSSAIIYRGNGPEVIGKCHRAIYYRHKGVLGDHVKPRSDWLMSEASALEQIVHEKSEEGGILINSNQSFRIYNPYEPEQLIKGEVDGLIRDPKTGATVLEEVKTSSGYSFKSDIYDKYNGEPRDSHLCQVAVYLIAFEIDYANLIYFDRGKLNHRTFFVRIDEDGYILVDDEPFYDMNTDSIFKRYAKIYNQVNNNEKPERDYCPKYSLEQIEEKVDRGEISKSVYKKYCDGKYKILNDFYCRYCNYFDTCIKNYKEDV